MFLVLLRLFDAATVAEHLPGHREWLQRGFADQVFFLTGGVPDAGGGAVLAANISRDDLISRVYEDPFVVHGVVLPEVIELDITMSDERLAFLNG